MRVLSGGGDTNANALAGKSQTFVRAMVLAVDGSALDYVSTSVFCIWDAPRSFTLTHMLTTMQSLSDDRHMHLLL